MIAIENITLEPWEIDYIDPEDDDDNVIQDFINAPWYRIHLNDDGFDRLGTWEVLADREELDGSSLELILEVIQPT